ncbi:MAG: InlB B-repeat-containing protein, partial [Eubacterium sp.]|nr:InlB B-repeat-containing protein [Eubacterium sp.]
MKKIISSAIAASMSLSLIVTQAPIGADDGDIDVWDFSGQRLAGTVNHIDYDVFVNDANVTGTAPNGGRFSVANQKFIFGNLEFAVGDGGNGARIYNGDLDPQANVKTANHADENMQSAFFSTYSDGYRANGGLYLTKSAAAPDDTYVKMTYSSGDIVTVYFAANGTDVTLNVKGPDGNTVASKLIDNEIEDSAVMGATYTPGMLKFTAPTTGAYTYTWESSTGRIFFNRIAVGYIPESEPEIKLLYSATFNSDGSFGSGSSPAITTVGTVVDAAYYSSSGIPEGYATFGGTSDAKITVTTLGGAQGVFPRYGGLCLFWEGAAISIGEINGPVKVKVKGYVGEADKVAKLTVTSGMTTFGDAEINPAENGSNATGKEMEFSGVAQGSILLTANATTGNRPDFKINSIEIIEDLSADPPKPEPESIYKLVSNTSIGKNSPQAAAGTVIDEAYATANLDAGALMFDGDPNVKLTFTGSRAMFPQFGGFNLYWGGTAKGTSSFEIAPVNGPVTVKIKAFTKQTGAVLSLFTGPSGDVLIGTDTLLSAENGSFGTAKNIEFTANAQGKIVFDATNYEGTDRTDLAIASIEIIEAELEYYTVSYNINGGTGAVAAETVVAGTEMTIAGGSSIGKAGSAFKGWSTDAAAVTADSAYAPGTKYVVNGNVELFAVWEEIPKDPELTDLRVDVWDIGAYQEENTDFYRNNIPYDYWNGKTNGNGGPASTGANIGGGNEIFGEDDEFTFRHNGGNDYISWWKEKGVKGDFSTPQITQTLSYPDGYKAEAYWYNNGSNNFNRGSATIKAKKGEVLTMYSAARANPTTETGIVFARESTAEDSTLVLDKQFHTSPANHKPFMASFLVPEDGTYRLYHTPIGSTTRPVVARITKTPPIKVTGTVDLSTYLNETTGRPSGYGLTFIDPVTKTVFDAVLDGDNFTAYLPAGYTFTAQMTNALGYGLTTDSKYVSTNQGQLHTGNPGVDLDVETKQIYKYSGKITGFASGYDVSNLEITMEVTDPELPDEDVDLTIVKSDPTNITFEADLSPDVPYKAVLKGVNDYIIKTGGTISSNEAVTEDIVVEEKPLYKATGNFKLLADGPLGKLVQIFDKNLEVRDDVVGDLGSGLVTALSFKNVDDGYTYPASVSETGYEVDLRDGAYEAVATIVGHTTTGHVVVKGAAAAKDILFVSSTVPGALEHKSDLYVGYPDKGADNYNSVQQAVNAAWRMNSASSTEADRITIHIAPGVYREQIVVSTPYITFINDEYDENDPNTNVVLTWYQGIGYVYYSARNRSYDAEAAFDKYEKQVSNNRWAATVWIGNKNIGNTGNKTGTGFRAENIIFENSYNYYLTDEELEDGIEPGGDPPSRFIRSYGVDVRSQAANERAAAFAIEADMVELYNCEFYGSQDTLYSGQYLATGNSRAYFKNCLIQGRTDYICGNGRVVFDQCTLSLYGASDNAMGSTHTAANNGNYWFNNCTIINNPDPSMKVGNSTYGRPWGTPLNVLFYNTKVDSNVVLVPEGWSTMSNLNQFSENVTFGEYNTTLFDGTPVDTSGRAKPPGAATSPLVLTEDPKPSISDAKYFESWVPYYYTPESAGNLAFTADPTISDYGDANLPRWGHTLTAVYSLGDFDANDVSLISWYKVKGNEEVLIKQTTANNSKAYEIQESDLGYNIKVTVTPKTADGKTAEAKSYTMAAAVVEGYDKQPAVGNAPPPGKGINIWLVGDSTVKDYGKGGVFSSNREQMEGSWGEYLRYFYDPDVVSVMNYANGGRSSRSLMNDRQGNGADWQHMLLADGGMKAGDYLFIQFGHNDGHIGPNADDRGTFLGEPDANGIYPTIPGQKDESGLFFSPVRDGTRSNQDQSGTYKWYLKEYIREAQARGVTPIIVTPVSRRSLAAGPNGTVTITTSNNHYEDIATAEEKKKAGYVIACHQVAEETGVDLIELYELSGQLYCDIHAADELADKSPSKSMTQMLFNDGGTHHNKPGGLLMAEIMVLEIQKLGYDISRYVKIPTQLNSYSQASSNNLGFSINGRGVVTAYTPVNGRATAIAGVYTSEPEPILTKFANDYMDRIRENIENAMPPQGYQKVNDIILTSTSMKVGAQLTLNATVLPSNATNKVISWSVKEAGNTGAVIDGSKLSANAVGTVKVTATVANGTTSDGTPFIKDFDIVVNPADVKPAGGTIWVIGDSTASIHNDTAYTIPRMGFGEKIDDLLVVGNGYTVRNISASGRSSKSFPNESAAVYNEFKNNVKDGDVLILGFGHNDEKNTDAARFSDPNLASNYVGTGSSFKANLKNLYIDIAMAKGAKVILHTPIVRRSGSNNYTGSSVHVTADGDYPKAIRDLAGEYNPVLPVIDMTEITKALYTQLGATVAGELHAMQTTSIDNTHTNDLGARYNAYLIANEIVTKNIHDLGTIFTLPLTAPVIPGAPSKTLNSIAITTAPGKTVYTAGESFDQTGMVVTATYSD